MEAFVKEIPVHSKLYDYQVLFVDDFSSLLEEYLEKSVYVIDRRVYDLYRDRFFAVPTERIFFMEAVEQKKNMDTVMELIHFWKSLSMKKNWKVICFGGGITQDVTTVAANLFLRNVDWFFFPTTLLSMCDSCIGGKCGINLDEYKNQIGVFYPPKKIFIDTCFLETLTEGDYLNGWGELLKFSLTKDTGFYEKILEENNLIPCENIAAHISHGLNVKKEIIEEDEFESDLRRVLNYGHTFGHALEAYTKYEVPHGKGVIWGIDVANFLAWKENLISEEYYLEIKKMIHDRFLCEEIIIAEPEKLFALIKTDKKVKDDILYFAMLNGRATLCVHPIRIDADLEDAFKNYLRETHAYYCG